MTRRPLEFREPIAGDSVERVSFVWIANFDEGESVATLDRYLQEIEGDPATRQLVVVNNGMGDSVSKRIVDHLHSFTIQSTVLSLHQPSAESVALTAAFRHLTGDIVVLLPSYLQSDPRGIRRLLDAVEGGLDFVASRRSQRVDSKGQQRKSMMFNRVTRWLAGVPIHDVNSELRAMRREVIEDLPLRGDFHVFLPILAARRGFRVGEASVRHLQERPSRTGHGFSGFLRRGLDLLTLFFLLRFTEKPFRFFGGIGSVLLATGGALNLMLAVERLIFRHALADRPMLILATLLMVLGIQMFSLGLIGELIIFVRAGGSSDYASEEVFEVTPPGSNRAVA